MDNIVIDDIVITVVKKRIKNLHLYVKRDMTVLITAPLRTSDKKIEEFASSKLSWIKKHLDKFQSMPPQIRIEYENGDIVNIFGKSMTLKVAEGTRYSASLVGNCINVVFRKGCTLKQKESFFDKWRRNILNDLISELLPTIEEKTGLHCNGWQIKSMKTRWGTCNTATKKIWFNLKLSEKPIECIEYVIVHELIHTIVPNHGDDFTNSMNSFLPDWRERKNLLNESR